MKVLVSVFNNLYTDQRVEKVCRTLYENGYEVELIGNDYGGLPKMDRPYKFSRIHLKNSNLRKAYPEFNYKLYREIIQKADKNTILLSNDLDTLTANYFASKKLRIPLVWDSHEIFTEMPSLQGRFTQKVWRFTERNLIKKVKYMMAASESYANWFVEKYHIKKPVVIQNFPLKRKKEITANNPLKLKKIILYQGWMNISRGIDKAIISMKYLDNAELWIAGDGPLKNDFEKLVKSEGVGNKIKFLGKLSPAELREITVTADVGISIEENNGLSYYYSLPNKISDYIAAKVPVVVSNFPEMKRIVEKFKVGEIIESHDPEEIADKINTVLQKGKDFYRDSLDTASSQLCWENEEPKLLELFAKVAAENY